MLHEDFFLCLGVCFEAWVFTLNIIYNPYRTMSLYLEVSVYTLWSIYIYIYIYYYTRIVVASALLFCSRKWQLQHIINNQIFVSYQSIGKFINYTENTQIHIVLNLIHKQQLDTQEVVWAVFTKLFSFSIKIRLKFEIE